MTIDFKLIFSLLSSLFTLRLDFSLGKYAADYDAEIDKSFENYPGPFVIATWVMEYLLRNPESIPPFPATTDTTTSSPASISQTSKKNSIPISNMSSAKISSPSSGFPCQNSNQDFNPSMTPKSYILPFNGSSSFLLSNDSPPPFKILDLGCGTGQSSALFFKHSESHRFQVSGIDATTEVSLKLNPLLRSWSDPDDSL